MENVRVKTVFDDFKEDIMRCSTPQEMAGLIDGLQTAAKLYNINNGHIEKPCANIDSVKLSVCDFIRYLDSEIE